MKKNSNVLETIVIILLVIAGIGVSWAGICGIVKLITMCFDLKFSWAAATGIYLVIVLISWWRPRNKE